MSSIRHRTRRGRSAPRTPIPRSASRPRSAFAAAFFAAVFALLLAPGLAAQKAEPAGEAPASSQDGVFIDTVDVSLVNVEVYVTDKDGNRVTGLTKDDFEILENGRPMTITNFSVVEAGRMLDPDAEEGPEPVAEPERDPLALPIRGTEAREPQVPEDQRLYLIVYVDNYNLQPFSRNRVLRELRDFLRNKLNPDDRVMLVTYDRELHVQHPWTEDEDVIARGLLDLETMSGSAVNRESDRRDALERIQESEGYQAAMSYARTYASNIFNDLSFTLDALRSMVDGLAGMPGRKAILYVSEGLPMVAGEDLFYAVQQKFRDYGSLTDSFEYDASRRFDELTASANANRVTFYTIDAGGLRTHSHIDASNQSAGLPGQALLIDQVYLSNLQSPLQMMAEETGGKAIINANRVTEPLEAVAQDFNTYYSLGYTPAHYGDGRYYRIEVKMKDKVRGTQVRHREGYRDKPTTQRMADGTRAALLHSFTANPLELRMDFGQPTPSDQGRFMVPVHLAIPLSKVVLVPGEGTYEARLKIFVGAVDESGGMSEITENLLPISIPASEVEKAQGQHWLYSVNLLMRRGPHRVAIGLRDEVGSEQSFVTRQLIVGGR